MSHSNLPQSVSSSWQRSPTCTFIPQYPSTPPIDTVFKIPYPPRSSNLNQVQLIALERQFSVNRYVSVLKQRELAKELQLTREQVRSWFSRKRRETKLSRHHSNEHKPTSATENAFIQQMMPVLFYNYLNKLCEVNSIELNLEKQVNHRYLFSPAYFMD